MPDATRCNAPGPHGLDCEGAPGHPGHHGGTDFGADDWRWNDEEAEGYRSEREQAKTAQGIDRGIVYTTTGQRWEGRLQMTEWGPMVALEQQADVSQVLLPWALVLRVTWSNERRT